jgi:hypothetical protein
MPETLSELFNGGLVTARHPSLLQAGELQRADDTVYREKDPAIWRAPGRTKVNTAALGSVWAGAAAGVKGLAHMSFQRTYKDQLVAYTGNVFSRANLTATTAPTLDPIDLSLSVTTVNTNPQITVVTTQLLVGWPVIGTNLPVGARIVSIDDPTHATLSVAPTSSTTLNYTFNPMLELGGPGNVAGTVTTNVFVATTGFPFLADIIGSTVYPPSVAGVPITGAIVTAVSGQSGTTGHYSTVTLTAGLVANGAKTIFFPQGVVQTYSDNGDEILDIAQYGGYYFVWTGRDTMRRVEWRPRKTQSATSYDDVLSVRPAGLNPVVIAPTCTQITALPAPDTTAPAWPPTLSTGYFWFLVTEIFDPDNTADGTDGPTEIESAYYGKVGSNNIAGEPVPVNIPALTGFGVQITFPIQVNTGADGRFSTHWGVYMLGPTNDPKSIPSLVGFRRVAKVRITAADGTQTLALSDSRSIQTGFSNLTTSISGFADFTNPNIMSSGAAGYSSGNNSDAFSGVGGTPIGDFLGNFGFVTGAPWSNRKIYGIRLTVRGAADDFGASGKQAGYLYALTAGTSKTTDEALGVFTRTSLDAQAHGGEMDTWGVAWTAADLANGTFKVILKKSPTGSVQHLRVTGVKVEVFFSSGSLNLDGKPFRVVTYRDQIGDSVSEPAAGPPPNCNTGDLYQGSLVVNDLGDETAIRFSLPGDPESFPKPYVMRFNTTKRKDRVTCIRTLGQVMLVGMENGIKRVNYLPTEIDTDFHEGLGHEDLASDHGIAGPLAAVKFDWPGRGTYLAYASFAGIFCTDTNATRPLNMDLDWANTVKLSALSTCVFRVYPKEKWLVLYYCPAGATHNKNTRALVFSYADDKVKNGDELPCTGPLVISGRSSVEVMVSGTHFLFTGHETNGFIYQEDFGVAQATGYQVHNSTGTLVNAPIVPIVLGRRLHPAGITHDSHLYKAYLLFSAFGTTNTAVADSTVGSTTLSSVSAVFTNVVAGMRVKSSTLDEGTIVLSVAGDFKSCVLSRAANATGAGVTFTFDTGTLGISDRGASIGETAAAMHTQWASTLAGDMIVVHLDDTRQGLELLIEKVPLTFTTNPDGLRYDTATWADLSTNMRLHQFMLLFDDQGPEQTRSLV